MSLVDWTWFTKRSVTRADVKRAEARTMREGALQVASQEVPWIAPRARHEAINEMLRLADEADAEATRLELGLKA